MFTFALPGALLLLPLPWILRYFLSYSPITPRAALKIPFYQKMTALNRHQPPTTSQLNYRTYLAYLTWFLLILASAGPQWLGAPIALPQSGRNLFLALDLSGSMHIPDMELNGKSADRLTVVKAVAKQFVSDRQGDRVGLILFGTRAYLQTPLTFDRKTVQHMLDDATVGLAGPQTAIGDAIGLAIKHFSHTPMKSRVLVLLTDGASNAGELKPLQAAELAAQQHIKIYTIGIGANQLMVPGLFGNQMINPSSDLDEGALKEISKITHGLFFRAENTADLKKVYEQLHQLEPVTQDKTLLRPIIPYYHWPLALAMLLSFYFVLRVTKPLIFIKKVTYG